MRAMEPTELLFWGVMSLGVIAGFATAYPANVWMVVRNLKHGLMTERKPGSRFDLGVQDKASADAEEQRGAHGGHGQHARRHGGMRRPAATACSQTPHMPNWPRSPASLRSRSPWA